MICKNCGAPIKKEGSSYIHTWENGPYKDHNFTYQFCRSKDGRTSPDQFDEAVLRYTKQEAIKLYTEALCDTSI